jgi:carbon-monoxide dehydrogenase small subunit
LEGLVKIELAINGQFQRVDVPVSLSLLSLLRCRFGLYGTKEGCGIGECGACSVLVDGRLVNACLMLAVQVDGSSIVTIEGLADPDGTPNDLQEAFIRVGAAQCGYCTPGMVLAGEALLARNPNPTRAEILEALAGNLCRCTGYHQIADAIFETAQRRAASPRHGSMVTNHKAAS